MAIRLDETHLLIGEVRNGRWVGSDADVDTITLDVGLREHMKAQKLTKLDTKLPEGLHASIALAGGHQGEQFRLRGQFESPTGGTSRSKTEHIVWNVKPGGRHVAIIKIGSRLRFTTTGEYHFRFYLNDQDIGSIPVKVCWEDEVPD